MSNDKQQGENRPAEIHISLAPGQSYRITQARTEYAPFVPGSDLMVSKHTVASTEIQARPIIVHSGAPQSKGVIESEFARIAGQMVAQAMNEEKASAPAPAAAPASPVTCNCPRCRFHRSAGGFAQA